jgi:hypothetical protein
MIDWRRSAPRTNRRGDKGSHCLTPLLHLNGCPGMPLKRIEDEPEERTTLTQEIHFSEKPLCLITCKITSYSLLSKVF